MVRKRKEDFSNYVSGVLQNSMLTGIPQIASAGNVPKKVIRALVFVACVVGFIYQSMIFMNLYWEYKTVIDVQVLSSKEAELPSITICNYSGLYASKICNDTRFTKKCSKLENDVDYGVDWCECLPGRYCFNGVLQDHILPSWTIYKELNTAEYKEYETLLQDFGDFVSYCTFYMASGEAVYTNCNLTYRQHIRCPTEGTTISACWTINTLVGRPNDVQPTILTGGHLTLMLAPHPEEYSTLLATVAAQIAIHNPRQIVNPYTQGFTMKLNTRHDFRVKKMVKKLLPHPYETNCIDYLQTWKARGGYGPTNQKECIEECQKNISLRVYDGCVSQYYSMPGNERRCKIEKYPGPEVLAETSECAEKNCKPACYEETYEVARDVADRQTQADCGYDEYKSFKQDILLNIYFNGMETTTYTYSPKYQNIETFSYLGGYVGMWLGISLVAVFDFLETLVVMLKYPFRRYTESKAKKQRIDHIKKLQRDL